MKITHASFSDTGLRRTNNEDYVLVDDALGLYLLADGLGGHQSGEVASKEAVTAIRDFFAANTDMTEDDLNALYAFREELPFPARKLVYAVIQANRQVTDLADTDSGLHGMGTTVVVMYRFGGALFLAHVGDSRVYLLRDRRLERLTEDHTVYNEQLRSGKYTEEELKHSPIKDKLARALGHMAKPRVDVRGISPKVGDIYLLCSDGLTNMVPEEAIMVILEEHGADLDRTGSALVAQALAGGGLDNVSLVLLRMDER